MLRDFCILASTALLAIVTLSTPSVDLSSRLAADLRGGEDCTEHEEDIDDPSCAACAPNFDGENLVYEKCNSSGTNWECDNYSGPVCQECFLGVRSACAGKLYRYPSHAACQSGGSGTELGDCPRTKNAMAYSETCVQNCDIVP